MRPVMMTVDVKKHNPEPSGDILRWLNSNIGPGVCEDIDAWRLQDIEWSMWFNFHALRIVVEFKRPESATLFALRWA